MLDVQREYPRAGRFRVRGLLTQRSGQKPPSERTVGRAMAINREHHGAPPAWATDRPDSSEPDGIVKEIPYVPTQQHRYWFIDFRYVVQLGEESEEGSEIQEAHWTYSLCVIEGYSRKILAGMATRYQDAVAVLQLLSAALAEYGSPEGIVSDNGSVFTSDAYEGLLEALGIDLCHIEKGKPWENLIESKFKIELRLADAAFAQAPTFIELQERHAAFVETFNTTPHWTHRARADGLQTPVEVLGWVRGRELAPDTLARALRQLQVERLVNRAGYVSVQRFYLYAERGLARQRVSVWLYDGRLHVAHREALLARYTYHDDRTARRLRAVEAPQLFHTVYASPQLELWELDDAQWRKVLERPLRRRRQLRALDARLQQLELPIVGLVLAFLTVRLG